MSVIVTLSNGNAHRLDRGLSVSTVVSLINEARGKGRLIPFDNDATPSRVLYIDPDEVVSVKNDGYTY